MKIPISLLVSFCMPIAVLLDFVSCPGGGGDDGPSIIPMELIYQHKDTALCTACNSDPQLSNGPHDWNHAAGPDGIYGDTINYDDCPHYSSYCAPASIAMITKAYGRTGVKIEQAMIYDGGKAEPPEAPDSGIVEGHGFGMYHGSNSTSYEVQGAFDFALDPITHVEYNAGNLITETIVKTV